jgi:hypothetical protein
MTSRNVDKHIATSVITLFIYIHYKLVIEVQGTLVCLHLLYKVIDFDRAMLGTLLLQFWFK